MIECPAWVSRAMPGAITSAHHARWGFRHETWIVTSRDGRRAVLQRRADGSDPTGRVARAVRDLVRAAGIPTPEPTRLPASTDREAIVVELPFVEGTVAAELLGRPGGAAVVGRLCGAISSRLRMIDVGGGELASTWASSGLLVAAVDQWLHGLAEPVPSETRALLDGARDRAASMVDASTSGLAHGDLAPVNVLVRDDAVAALLDLDRAQLAHPVYDAAWFSWVVSFHHPEIAPAACAAYAAAAGVAADESEVGWLWPLLLLERLAAATDERERVLWAGRLAAAGPSPKERPPCTTRSTTTRRPRDL